MSAFVVSDAHLNYLVNGALKVKAAARSHAFYWHHGGARLELTSFNAREVGQMLLDENYRSVNARYRESEKPHEFAFEQDFRSALDPVQLLKAVKCYEYQACEHPELEASETAAFCRTLKEWTIAQLPGYQEKAWEIGETAPAR